MSSSLVNSPLDIQLWDLLVSEDHWTLCLVVATTVKFFYFNLLLVSYDWNLLKIFFWLSIHTVISSITNMIISRKFYFKLDIILSITELIKFTNGRLSFSLFYFLFLFYFWFVFLFSIFRTTRVRVDQSRCHISHNLMA